MRLTILQFTKVLTIKLFSVRLVTSFLAELHILNLDDLRQF